jgi:hypothetical protein
LGCSRQTIYIFHEKSTFEQNLNLRSGSDVLQALSRTLWRRVIPLLTRMSPVSCSFLKCFKLIIFDLIPCARVEPANFIVQKKMYVLQSNPTFSAIAFQIKIIELATRLFSDRRRTRLPRDLSCFLFHHHRVPGHGQLNLQPFWAFPPRQSGIDSN